MSKSNAAFMGALIVTVVLSAIMLLKSVLGLLPSVNAIQMLTGISANFLGTPATPAIGWIWHFVIGVGLWGVLFGALYEVLPGNGSVAKGLLFSTGTSAGTTNAGGIRASSSATTGMRSSTGSRGDAP